MAGASQNSLVKLIIAILAFITFFNNPNLCLCRCPDYESEALLRFKSLSTASDGSFNSWVNGTDCCMWHGVECDEEMNHVIMVGNGLTGTLPSCLGNSSYLEALFLAGHSLSGQIPSTFCGLTDLTVLELSGNQLNGSLTSCLGNLSSVTDLYLQGNKLSGSIPSSVGGLSSLNFLYISNNLLSGPIPHSIGSLSSLTDLDVSFNNLSDPIPLSLGNLSSLTSLDISFNKFGTLPSSFAQLYSLTILRAEGNPFNENILSLPFPSSISSLSLTLNQTISENFFHNLSRLSFLHLSHGILNISTTWIPEFQLVYLNLKSCYIGGQIPDWISTQISLSELTLIDNNLYGEIPSWLFSPPMRFLTLSRNHLQGKLLAASKSVYLSLLDLSRNELTGPMPSEWPQYLGELRLNDNRLNGNIPPSLGTMSGLSLINLANNHLNGTIPPSLVNCRYFLRVLNLGSNNLEGTIPKEFGNMHLVSFVIKNNRLNGLFPDLVLNFSGLKVLDIGNNSFEGQISKSIGNLSELKVLIMKGNLFSGQIPAEIGQLKRLQIFDISSNNLSGSIPSSITSLQAMSVATQDGNILNEDMDMEFVGHHGRGSYEDDLNMTSKGGELYYPYILSTLIGIDLSRNQLNGDIPFHIGKLKGMRFLNMSMNNLSGIIPHSLGGISQLESLDLSSTNLLGSIPSELQSLTSLAYLNLSNNNLSGNIPQGGQMTTFGNNSYFGNPNLQGCPLPKNCPWPEYRSRPSHPPLGDAEHNDEAESEQIPWYHIGVGWSYGAGFLAVVVLLIAISNKWRNKYFRGVDDILNFIFPSMRNKKI